MPNFLEDNHNFDLLALLKLKELDIRRVAHDNPLLRVGEYNRVLSKFINYNTKIISTLDKISSPGAKESDFSFMADVKTLLMNMGCYKLMPLIDDIISTGKRGHNKFASDYAKKMLEEHNNLYAKIILTIEEDDKVDKTTGEDEIIVSKETQVLKKVIHLMDHNEATRKMRILAVDDTPSILKMISAILADDYKVDTLINPVMVEKFLQQITPELFLLDYQMPELNGFDLVPIIRSFEEHKDTPIIFLTAMGTIDHVSIAYTLGACDYIVKPFKDSVLLEKVAKHIVRKKLF